ncbi:MAG: hypothetical protein IPJ65_25640 [Archangiaceae bacterium]|nr:hypothetical protein [Archangiaceae bacterium]
MTSAIVTLFVLAGSPAPLITADTRLQCPAGTAQFGGPSSKAAVLTCTEGSREGMRMYHGPYVSFYADGKVEAVGQTDHGMRSGKWSFYDAAGTLVGETEFKNGDFHGRRVFYFADGKVKAEERWVAGVQQLARPASATGTATTRP